ncbi:MAG: hypothetical protein FWB96_08325, partial [Defluviitaleaceae bacterium]|nr:hypothetical protein [Defluviitaleaceae bacterium]
LGRRVGAIAFARYDTPAAYNRSPKAIAPTRRPRSDRVGKIRLVGGRRKKDKGTVHPSYTKGLDSHG